MKIKKIILFLLFLLVCKLTVSAAISASERAALIALYNATGGDIWTDSSGWKTEPLDTDGFAMPGTEGGWYGITVTADQVTSIALNANNLSGSIPGELFNLSNLQFLYFSTNHLTGSIPAQIGSLSSLVGIDLGYNELTGIIPVELGSLSGLQAITLCSNQLTGSIPAEIGNLSNLQVLNLYVNQLSGSMPSELGNLSNLQVLYLNGNQLTGSIPTQLGSLNLLTNLNLSFNGLSGSIPTELGSLSNLTSLELNNNQLTGSIPTQLGSLSNLTNLELSNNQLTGTIPTELGNLTHLITLRLAGNQSSGVIPGSLTNLVHLNEDSGDTDIGYNALYSFDPTLIAFLNDKDPNWASTQTVAPANVQAATINGTSIMVSWVPIPYTGDTGGYRVLYSVTSGGPYTFFTQTTDKNVTSQLVSGLVLGGTYYFVVQARTEPHNNNQNTVDSEYSGQASAIASGQLAISGIVTLSGNPLSNVVMSGLPGDPVTDASGNYSVMVEPWWSGTVTPTLAGLAFTPASRSYVNIAADRISQNYSAAEGSTEPNDDPATAAELSLGTTEGLIFVANEIDCYKFFVPAEAAGQDLRVNVRVTSPYPDPIPSNWRSDLDFELLDSSLRVLGITISGSDNETIYLHEVASGWYYVCVVYNETEYADSSGFARYAVTLETGTEFGLGYISGRVVDGSGQGIEDAFLILDPASGETSTSRPYMTTGPDGYYTIAFTPGTYTLLFSGGGGSGTISIFHTPVNVVGEYYNDKKILANAEQLSFSSGQTVILEDAVLETGAIASGHVTNLSDTPLSNVQVRWFNLEGNTYSREFAFTDANGDFTLGGGPVGGGKLRFSKGGYAAEFYNDKTTFGLGDTLPTVAGGTIIDADAQLGSGGRITGTVTDRLGTGIRNVWVRLYSALDGTYPYAGAMSTSSGSFAFRVPPGEYKIFFNATGLDYTSEWYTDAYSFAAATVVNVSEDGTTSGIDVQLDSKLILSGTIDLAGYPLANVVLSGMPGNPVTDASGNYSAQVDCNWSGTVTPTLAGFAFTPSNRVYANVTAGQSGQNYTAAEANTEPNNDPASAVELPMGTTAGLIYVAGEADCYKFFVPAAAAGQDLRVNVRVTSPYPDPIPDDWGSDLDFQLLDSTSRNLGITVSSSDNETLYLHEIASGWYYVYVNFCSTDYADSSAYARYTVTLETGNSFGLGYISGRVVDGGGAGIENVFLYLDPLSSDWEISRPYMTTGADGYFTIACIPGIYTLLFTNGGTRTAFHTPPNVVFEYFNNTRKYADAEHISLSGGQTLELGNIALDIGAIISGHVTDLSDNALGNVQVLGFDLDGITYSGELALTNINGDYTINGIPIGGAKIRFSRNTYAMEFYDDKPTLGSAYTLPTVAGGTIVGVNAKLGRGGTISGTVTDGTGAGIANVRVRLYSVHDGTFARVNGLTAGGSGNYTFSRVIPGDYRVYFDTTGLGFAPEWYSDAYSFSEATAVSVTEQTTTSGIDAVLLPATIIVTSPGAGTRWTVGSAQAITWEGKGAVGSIKIEFSLDNGANWIVLISTTENDGSFAWTLPQKASSTCLVRISEADGDAFGLSGIFSIEPWLPQEGMQYNMIVHGTAYNGSDTAASGDWIGAFAPGGECRATAQVGANGSYYLTVCGNEVSAENITFKLWPQTSGAGIDSLETIEFVADKVYGGLPLHFGPRTQEIALVNGWNWVSWNILPADTSLSGMFAPLLGQIQQIKTQTQAAVYSGGSWIGDLADMSGVGSGIMYKIKTNQAGSLSLTAPGIPFDLPITAVTGWNWVAYLPAQSQPVTPAVGSIFDAVKQVKSQTQSVIKISGVLSGDLTEMQPNLGFTIKVTEPGVLVYPYGLGASVSMAKSASLKQTEVKGVPNWEAINGNQYNMVAYGKVHLDGSLIAKEGYFLGTFGPRGTSDCRSVGTVNPEGYYFATIRGDTIGEAVRFVLYDSDNGKSYETSKSVAFLIDGLQDNFDLHFSSVATCTISGTVTCAGVPLAGVTLSGLTGDPQTDAAGYYSAAVNIGWSGTVTPSKSGYVFTPASTTYADVADSQSTSYTASALSLITVTSPNGDESWAPGSTQNVTWVQDGLTGNVTLELYKNEAFQSILGTPAAAAGTFSWSIPTGQAAGNDYKIRASQGTIEDFSDGTFTIALVPSDFNVDGLSDILWRYYGTGGRNQVWLIGKTGMATQAESEPAPADNALEAETEHGEPDLEEVISDKEMTGSNLIVAADPHQTIELPSGDLNAVCASKLLLASTEPSQSKASLAVLRTINLASRPDTGWKIAGTGDFNHDGKIDIIWRHVGLGKNQIWLMNGKACKAVVRLPSPANRKWQIVGTGDFNNDDHVDILWRYYGKGGYNTVWLMNGTKKIAAVSLPAMPDTLWVAAGCGDFNSDRKPDIVWRYQGAGGANVVWLMDGTSLSEQQALPAESDLMWKIGGVGDCNGDGKTDLIWRYYGTGGTDIVWLMDGLELLSQETLPARTNLKWKIENH